MIMLKNITNILKELFLRFGRFVQAIINFLLLIPVYFIGVGTAAMAYKLSNQKNLFENKGKWIERDPDLDNNDLRMF